MNKRARMPSWRRNLYGGLLIIAGVIMLFTPGQGLLTLLAGFLLLDFPGKRRTWRKILSYPKTGTFVRKAHLFLKNSYKKYKKDLPES